MDPMVKAVDFLRATCLVHQVLLADAADTGNGCPGVGQELVSLTGMAGGVEDGKIWQRSPRFLTTRFFGEFTVFTVENDEKWLKSEKCWTDVPKKCQEWQRSPWKIMD